MMILKILVCMLFAHSATLLQEEGNLKPCLEVDQREIDYGVIWQGEERKETIQVRNRGEAPLHISRVMSSCGCAKADLWKDVTIPPQGSRELGVQLSNKEKKYFGKLKKSIRLYSDDPEEPLITLWVNLEIKADFWPEQRVVQFSNVTRSGVKKQTVMVRSYMEEPLELTEISSPSKFMGITFRQVSPMDEEKGYALYALDMEVDGARIARNRHRINTFVSFKSNSKRIMNDKLLIQILFLPEDIEITPDALIFDQCRQGEGQEKVIRLKHGEGKDFTVSEATSSSPYITTVIIGKGRGESEIKVMLAKNAPLGMVRAEIRIVIDYNAHNVVTIPVRGRVSSGAEEDEASGKQP